MPDARDCHPECRACAAVGQDDLTTAFADAVIARTAELKFLQTCLELRDGDVAALQEENERLKDLVAALEAEAAEGAE